MKEFESHFKNAKEKKLTPGERNMMRGRLAVFMHEHPAKGGAMADFAAPRVFGFAVGPAAMRLVAIAAIAIIAGSGTALAAGNSLPGDPLYPVKINVNEKVLGWFAVGTKAKAEFETNLAAERLREAEQLASEGRLTSSTDAEVQNNFAAHANAAEKLVAKLADDDDLESAAEINSDLQSSLKAHAEVLGRLQVPGLAARADSEAKSAEDDSAKIDGEVASASSTRLRVAASRQFDLATRALQSMDSVGANASGTVAASALAQARADLSDGQTKLDAGDYAQAFVLFREAKQLADQARVLLKAQTEFKINGHGDEGNNGQEGADGGNIAPGGHGEDGIRINASAGAAVNGEDASGSVKAGGDLRVRGGDDERGNENSNDSGDHAGSGSQIDFGL